MVMGYICFGDEQEQCESLNVKAQFWSHGPKEKETMCEGDKSFKNCAVWHNIFGPVFWVIASKCQKLSFV